MKETIWRPTSLLPKTRTNILLAIKDGRIELGYYKTEDSSWYRIARFKDDTVGYQVPEAVILGWLPLPPLPKEKIFTVPYPQL